MEQTIEKIIAYIKNTRPVQLSRLSTSKIEPSYSDIQAILNMAKEKGHTGIFNAVTLALFYGQATGLRMGRIEAKKMKRAE